MKLRAAAGAVVVLLGSILAFGVPFASAAPAEFPDVPQSSPYYAAIADLAAGGVITGYDDGNFGPADPVTREQFAKMIVLVAGYPVSEADVCHFRDVTRSDASTLFPDNYVAVCAARGITVGKTALLFDPYSSITRYQAVSMVVRAADELRPGLLAAPPAAWTGNTVWGGDPTHGASAARAEYNGVLAGLDLATLDPRGSMTRAEVAQVLHDLLSKIGQPVAAPVSLTATAAAGTGTITVSPEGNSFEKGTAVTLTAVPASGYAFAGWGGDASGLDNPVTVVMDADTSVTASFVAATPNTNFQDLGGVLTSAPAMCSQGYNLLDVFARSATGSLLHWHYSGTGWAGPEDLGGSIQSGSDPVAVSSGVGRLDVLVRGTDDALWHRSWDGTGWSAWENLGGVLAASPAAACQTIGAQTLLQVFILAPGGQISWKTFDGTSWSSWTTPGRDAPPAKPGLSPAAVTWGGSRVDLLFYGANGVLWHNYLATNGTWGDWEAIDVKYSSNLVACTWWSWAEGRLDLFQWGSDGGIWHRSQVSGIWSTWTSVALGAVGSKPAAVSWEQERFQLVVRGTNGALWYRQYSGSSWTS